MDSFDAWFPYAVTNLISVILIFIGLKWPGIGKVVWGAVFLLAGVFNLYTVSTNTEAYLGYSQWAITPYQDFINGIFSDHTALIVSAIALGQILVGVLLFLKKRPFQLGIAGGIIFLIAICPLGLGSAFPAPLLMATSLTLVYFRYGQLA